ncbi:hypothetical protein EGW08_017982 [Elysia chlorotica]|uniref:Uncharacterized protein n=1 Tax=Elysia chlorotica TaxID=188477 RepID=A0A3S0ZGE6_ELYCH|nr:hypothetical protein EGW08_017982 [Elysia chlorotica]
MHSAGFEHMYGQRWVNTFVLGSQASALSSDQYTTHCLFFFLFTLCSLSVSLTFSLSLSHSLSLSLSLSTLSLSLSLSMFDGLIFLLNIGKGNLSHRSFKLQPIFKKTADR